MKPEQKTGLHPSDKMVLSRLKPSMSKEEMKKNLVAGLKRSGFKVQGKPAQS